MITNFHNTCSCTKFVIIYEDIETELRMSKLSKDVLVLRKCVISALGTMFH